MAALVEVLQRKGILTDQELDEAVREHLQHHLHGGRGDVSTGEPPTLTRQEQDLADRLLKALRSSPLGIHQAKKVLGGVFQLIESEEWTATRVDHE